jgi:hypothetical protein
MSFRPKSLGASPCRQFLRKMDEKRAEHAPLDADNQQMETVDA